MGRENALKNRLRFVSTQTHNGSATRRYSTAECDNGLFQIHPWLELERALMIQHKGEVTDHEGVSRH